MANALKIDDNDIKQTKLLALHFSISIRSVIQRNLESMHCTQQQEEIIYEGGLLFDRQFPFQKLITVYGCIIK